MPATFASSVSPSPSQLSWSSVQAFSRYRLLLLPIVGSGVQEVWAEAGMSLIVMLQKALPSSLADPSDSLPTIIQG